MRWQISENITPKLVRGRQVSGPGIFFTLLDHVTFTLLLSSELHLLSIRKAFAQYFQTVLKVVNSNASLPALDSLWSTFVNSSEAQLREIVFQGFKARLEKELQVWYHVTLLSVTSHPHTLFEPKVLYKRISDIWVIDIEIREWSGCDSEATLRGNIRALCKSRQGHSQPTAR